MKLYLLNNKGVSGYLDKKAEVKQLKLLTLLSRDLLNGNAQKHINKIIATYKQSGLTNSNMVFAFNNDFNKAVFTNEELKSLKSLIEHFQKYNIKVGVYSEKGFYDYNQVENTCNIIKDETTEILSYRHYSPLEKLMHAYCKVASREYIEEDEKRENRSISRSIYGITNSDKIVCKGYAFYLQALLTQMKDDNLKCFVNSFGMITHIRGPKDKIELSSHATNIVYIDDKKYGVKGFFHVDPTWDFSRGKPKTYRLAYFLLNLADINKVYPDSVRDLDYTEIIEKRFGLDDDEPKIEWLDFCMNTNWTLSCSLSLDGTKLKLQDHVDKMHQENLGDYLLSRQDFIDFLVLEQTARDCKNGKGSFDECLNKNYELAQKDVKKLNVFKSKKVISQYLYEHTSKVDMKEIVDCLAVVVKDFEKGSKDDKSKRMYEILKESISYSEYVFEKDATSDFVKAEM